MEYIRQIIYVCRGCQWVDCNMNSDGWDIDKCPYCKGDDWAEYHFQPYKEEESEKNERKIEMSTMRQ